MKASFSPPSPTTTSKKTSIEKEKNVMKNKKMTTILSKKSNTKTASGQDSINKNMESDQVFKDYYEDFTIHNIKDKNDNHVTLVFAIDRNHKNHKNHNHVVGIQSSSTHSKPKSKLSPKLKSKGTTDTSSSTTHHQKNSIIEQPNISISERFYNKKPKQQHSTTNNNDSDFMDTQDKKTLVMSASTPSLGASHRQPTTSSKNSPTGNNKKSHSRFKISFLNGSKSSHADHSEPNTNNSMKDKPVNRSSAPSKLSSSSHQPETTSSAMDLITKSTFFGKLKTPKIEKSHSLNNIKESKQNKRERKKLTRTDSLNGSCPHNSALYSSSSSSTSSSSSLSSSSSSSDLSSMEEDSCSSSNSTVSFNSLSYNNPQLQDNTPTKKRKFENSQSGTFSDMVSLPGRRNSHQDLFLEIDNFMSDDRLSMSDAVTNLLKAMTMPDLNNIGSTSDNNLNEYTTKKRKTSTELETISDKVEVTETQKPEQTKQSEKVEAGEDTTQPVEEDNNKKCDTESQPVSDKRNKIERSLSDNQRKTIKDSITRNHASSTPLINRFSVGSLKKPVGGDASNIPTPPTTGKAINFPLYNFVDQRIADNSPSMSLHEMGYSPDLKDDCPSSRQVVSLPTFNYTWESVSSENNVDVPLIYRRGAKVEKSKSKRNKGLRSNQLLAQAKQASGAESNGGLIQSFQYPSSPSILMTLPPSLPTTPTIAPKFKVKLQTKTEPSIFYIPSSNDVFVKPLDDKEMKEHYRKWHEFVSQHRSGHSNNNRDANNTQEIRLEYYNSKLESMRSPRKLLSPRTTKFEKEFKKFVAKSFQKPSQLMIDGDSQQPVDNSNVNSAHALQKLIDIKKESSDNLTYNPRSMSKNDKYNGTHTKFSSIEEFKFDDVTPIHSIVNSLIRLNAEERKLTNELFDRALITTFGRLKQVPRQYLARMGFPRAAKEQLFKFLKYSSMV
eukprot:TRINITY_DN1080_c0_g1_i2.p1 TRINITY_DN1080_c0_g1~~TRINITY_DN1080_c0_g1_i2.p1  ORF type:complete len:947 (+),score=295.13 TRINITY_DN1080_c0_g1_i2:98-2938(+)